MFSIGRICRIPFAITRTYRFSTFPRIRHPPELQRWICFSTHPLAAPERQLAALHGPIVAQVNLARVVVLRDRHLSRERLSLAFDDEGDELAVDQLLVLDDVGRFSSVDADELVTDAQIHARSRGIR